MRRYYTLYWHFPSLLRARKHTTQLGKYYPGSRGPFPKYLIWNKPCLRFDKAPETLFFSLGALGLIDAAWPRTVSIDKKKYPLEPRVVKYICPFMSLSTEKNRIRCMQFTYIFQHSKRNFVSPSGHVLFYLLYRQQWNSKPVHLNIFFAAKGAIY